MAHNFNLVSDTIRTIPDEKNDCAVIAVSLAFQKTYDEIHSLFKDVGRKHRKGVYGLQIEQVLYKLTDKLSLLEYAAPINGYYRAKYPTFKQFAVDHPVGRFIVIRKGHATTLIDGVWHDRSIRLCTNRHQVRLFYRVD